MPKPLIAISGKLKSGKTTLARILSDELEIPRYALAEPIKQAALALGDTDPWGSGKDRYLQQGIGNLLTSRDTNHLVKLWFEQHPDFRETGAINDDIRRRPEYDRFRAEGFVMVRLDVSRETQIARGAPDDETLDDPTETGLDHISDWDLVLGENLTVPERLASLLHYLRATPYQDVIHGARVFFDYLDQFKERYADDGTPKILS